MQERAVARAEQAREVDPGDMGDLLEELARVNIYLGDISEAEILATRAVAIKEESLGRGAPETLNALSALASIYRFQGRYQLSESTFREVLGRRRALKDPDLTVLTGDMLQIADLLRTQGKDLEGAETLAGEAVTRLHDGSGYGNRNYAWGLTRLACIREDQGDLEEAERLLSQAVSIRKRTFGDLHPLIAEALGEQAGFLTRNGRPREAEVLLREAERIDLHTVGRDHTRHAGTLAGLARALAAQGHLEEADSVIQASLQIRIAAQGRRSPPVAQVMAYQAEIRLDMGRFNDSEAILLEALDILSDQPTQGGTSALIHATFVRLYEAWGKPEMAERHRPFSGKPS